jgi:GntR family transcriptional regulator
MLFEIDTHSGVPIFRQIIDQIRKQITTGLLPEGRQLETVRDLAARLKVNPMTISKAYSLLEAEGLLDADAASACLSHRSIMSRRLSSKQNCSTPS